MVEQWTCGSAAAIFTKPDVTCHPCCALSPLCLVATASWQQANKMCPALTGHVRRRLFAAVRLARSMAQTCFPSRHTTAESVTQLASCAQVFVRGEQEMRRERESGRGVLALRSPCSREAVLGAKHKEIM